MFKLDEPDLMVDEVDSFNSDSELNTESGPTDTSGIMSLKASQQSMRPKSKASKKHSRAPSKDVVPQVSDYVKYSRSTFVASPKGGNNIYQQLKSGAQQNRNRVDSQVILDNEKNPREIMEYKEM